MVLVRSSHEKGFAVGRCANIRFSKRETVGALGGSEGRDSGWESRKNSEQSGQAREGYALKGYSVLMPNAFVPP